MHIFITGSSRCGWSESKSSEVNYKWQWRGSEATS